MLLPAKPWGHAQHRLTAQFEFASAAVRALPRPPTPGAPSAQHTESFQAHQHTHHMCTWRMPCRHPLLGGVHGLGHTGLVAHVDGRGQALAAQRAHVACGWDRWLVAAGFTVVCCPAARHRPGMIQTQAASNQGRRQLTKAEKGGRKERRGTTYQPASPGPPSCCPGQPPRCQRPPCALRSVRYEVSGVRCEAGHVAWCGEQGIRHIKAQEWARGSWLQCCHGSQPCACWTGQPGQRWWLPRQATST